MSTERLEEIAIKIFEVILCRKFGKRKSDEARLDKIIKIIVENTRLKGREA